MKTYHFDKNRCTEPLDGIVHACAVLAAVACLRPFSFIPEVEA